MAARASLQSPYFLAAFACICGSAAALCPWPPLLLLVFYGALFVRSMRWGCIALMLFTWVGFRGQAELGGFVGAHRRAAAELHAPSRCAFLAQVEVSPVVRLNSDADPMASLLVSTERLDCEGRLIAVEPGYLIGLSLPRDRIVGASFDQLGRGDALEVVAQLAPTRAFVNQGLSSPFPRLAKRGALYSGSVVFAEFRERGRGLHRLIDAFRTHVRRRILATYAPQVEGLGRALVLGENDLVELENESFRESGLMHLLAVSGTHLVIAVVGLMQLLRAVLVRCYFFVSRFDVMRSVYLFGAVFSLLYADFSGGSGSAWRAAFMLSLVSAFRVAGRKLSGLHALASSVVLGLVCWPLSGLDYSFLLSAFATLGLLFLGQPLLRFFESRRKLPAPAYWALASFLATLSSTIPCLPLIFAMSDSLTFAALAGNLVAGPLGELAALPACLAHTLMAPLPGLERGLALLGSGALLGVRATALASAAMTSMRFSVPLLGGTSIALTIGVVLLLLRFWGKLRRLSGPSLLVLLVLFGIFLREERVQAAPELGAGGELSVTLLDVGQGDSILVQAPKWVMLVDGGGFPMGRPDPGERVVLPMLRSRGIAALDVLAVSHDHPDHVSGLLAVAQKHEFAELWWPGRKPLSSTMRELLRIAESKGARVWTGPELCRQQKKRGPRRWGALQLQIFWPCERLPEMSANDLSLVMKLHWGERSALLTGDIEGPAEAALVAQKTELNCDFLKLAHHGSHTSTSDAFLQAARPRFAGASAGIRNRFGHPRLVTVRKLIDRAIPFFDTIRDGSITWTTDGQSQWISTETPIQPHHPMQQRPLLPPTAQ